MCLCFFPAPGSWLLLGMPRRRKTFLVAELVACESVGHFYRKSDKASCGREMGVSHEAATLRVKPKPDNTRAKAVLGARPCSVVSFPDLDLRFREAGRVGKPFICSTHAPLSFTKDLKAWSWSTSANRFCCLRSIQISCFPGLWRTMLGFGNQLFWKC